jgi:hypothetical protein
LSQPFEPERLRDGVKQSLASAGFGQALIDTVDAQLVGKTPEDFISTLSDVSKASADLVKDGFGPMLNNLQGSAEAINKFRQALVDNYETISQQRQTGAGSFSTLRDLQAEFVKTRAKFSNTDPNFNFGNYNSLREAEDLAGTSNVTELDNQLKTLSSMFQATGDPRFVSQIKLTKEALNKLAQSGTRTADAFSKLSQIESQRESTNSFARQFYGGGITDKMNMIQGLRDSSQFAANDKLTFNDVAPQVAKRVIDVLTSLGTASNASTMGIPANELLDKITQRSLGFEYKGDEKKALQQQILNTQLDAINAQKTLAENEREIFNNLVRDLSAENRNFPNG